MFMLSDILHHQSNFFQYLFSFKINFFYSNKKAAPKDSYQFNI
ncbi:hypothetical protein ACINIS251_1084 [Acinetobacter baumannii IS-251]|uniref:Uncharacterized protein n=1 Tax=Acinetobacter baumannii MRSN 3527 TaxID=1409923 RepID=A0A0J0ZM80_ACIBA|nr:hypothetical protein AN415_02680 [Acinetobacter baumannii]EGJ58805.1 hypothetical protein HMPREF0021_03545 [Acinetobacter baumannii 6013150]EGJ64757.1 hypothetical protein HMPREF0020_01609 [Acinetobacter baumannii 6013113]EJO40017.1 hypothetical protein ACINBC5_A1363 [Acinetobacter baumannii Canada BC-5]EKA75593.1 hypothetical protein ACINIS58_1147 [Acinetobacter baumannii IS-58]EKK06506.1 hypothetical protein ACINIS235_1205 [Acinetobacter baumannii IS-235]EKK19082.1 hypothetical protein A